VLGGDQHLVDADRPAVAVVAHGHLRLAVRPEVRQDAGLPRLGQAPGEPVRERDRRGHQLRRFVRRVAEHHPLVAGADLVVVVAGALAALLVRAVDTLGDVRGLPVQRRQDAHGVAVVAEVAGVVANPADRGAGDVGVVDVGVGGDLAGDDDEAGGQQRLHRDPRGRVLGQRRVQDGIGDLVGDLVRMSFGHRLGGEVVSVLFVCHVITLCSGQLIGRWCQGRWAG